MAVLLGQVDFVDESASGDFGFDRGEDLLCGVDVLIDEDRRSQVVENLLTNAIEYTDVGEVTLRLLPFDYANAMAGLQYRTPAREYLRRICR